MAVYDVLIGPALTLAPATVVEEILQNVRMILTTPRGSAPLHRDFGVDGVALDGPMTNQASLTADIIAAVATWEPRARVLSVSYSGTALAAQLHPTVRIEIDDDALVA